MTDKGPLGELASSSEAAAVAELAYFDGEGKVRVRPITPLVLGGEAAFTLSYADAGLAEELRRSPEACLVFHDSRLAYVGWKPLAVAVELEMTTDLGGDLFREELLEQELNKYPPERKLLDSMLLRRENWWYLPRFVFQAAEVGGARPVERRGSSPGRAVLAWEADDGALAADTVDADDWEEERIYMRPLAGRELPQSRNAALHRHDFTVPDMELGSSLLAVGEVGNGRLTVAGREGGAGIGEAPGLVARWREFRDLRKRCKAEIAKHERNPGSSL